MSTQAGLSADGVTPNNETTMFCVNNACTVTGFSAQGMIGFIHGSEPENQNLLKQLKVYFLHLIPNGAITTKSYIKDCPVFPKAVLVRLWTDKYTTLETKVWCSHIQIKPQMV